MTATRTLSAADFAVPIGERYFEDYHPGAQYEYGYATVTEARVSRSKPDRGLIRTRAELLNDDGGCALSLLAMNLVGRRDPG